MKLSQNDTDASKTLVNKTKHFPQNETIEK